MQMVHECYLLLCLQFSSHFERDEMGPLGDLQVFSLLILFSCLKSEIKNNNKVSILYLFKTLHESTMNRTYSFLACMPCNWLQLASRTLIHYLPVVIVFQAMTKWC